MLPLKHHAPFVGETAALEFAPFDLIASCCDRAVQTDHQSVVAGFGDCLVQARVPLFEPFEAVGSFPAIQAFLQEIQLRSRGVRDHESSKPRFDQESCLHDFEGAGL
jgi:hypothetical protein